MTELLTNTTEENLDKALKVLENLIHKASELNFFFFNSLSACNLRLWQLYNKYNF